MFYIVFIEVIICFRIRSVGKLWENVIVIRDINNIIILLFNCFCCNLIKIFNLYLKVCVCSFVLYWFIIIILYIFYNGKNIIDCLDRDLNNFFSYIRNEIGYIINFLLKDNL